MTWDPTDYSDPDWEMCHHLNPDHREDELRRLRANPKYDPRYRWDARLQTWVRTLAPCEPSPARPSRERQEWAREHKGDLEGDLEAR